jgi:PAS domain S-box-containing protein
MERVRAEAALAASETSYRAIFESAEDAIFVHDWDTGAIVDVNPTACRVFGWSRDEMLKLDVEEFSSNVAPYTRETALHYLDAARRGQVVRFEWHRRNRDGSLHWDEAMLKAATIGGKRRVLSFAREISDRKRAELALRASEEQYRAIFEAATDSLQLLDAQHRVVDVNPAYERMYGKRRDEVIGKTLTELVPAPLRQERQALVERALAGEAAELLTTGFRGDGTPFDLEVRVIPFRHRGEPHVLGIARDITGRKKAEEALRASEEQYRAIFNASADALVLRAADFRIVDVNATYERMSGWTRDEVVGLDRVVANPAEVAPTIRALHERALAGEAIALEVPLGSL